jgi:hypothetical protein
VGKSYDMALIEYATERVRERTARVEQQTARIQLITALLNLTARWIGAWVVAGSIALALLIRVLS